MKLDFFKNNRSNILISISIGILLFYCQPILKFFGDKTIDFLISVSSTFSDFYYSAIGHDTTSIILLSTNYIVILIITYGILSLLYYITNQLNTSIKKTKDLLIKIDGDENKETNNDPEVLETQLIQLRLDIEKTNKKLVMIKKIGLPILYTISGLGIGLFLALFQFTSSIDTKNNVFEHSLTVIAPSVNDHEIKVLKSEWAQINSKKDFLKINLKIDSIKTNYEQHVK